MSTTHGLRGRSVLSRCWNNSGIRLLSSHFGTFLEVREAELKCEFLKPLKELSAIKLRIDACERTFASAFGFGDLAVDFLPTAFDVVATLLVHYSNPSRRKSCKGSIKL